MENELSLFADDPVNRLFARMGFPLHHRRSLRVRVGLCWAVTWLPTCLLAVAQGVWRSDSLRESYAFDFAAYAQFWINLPLFWIAEHYGDERIKAVSVHLTRSGLLGDAEREQHSRLVATLRRWSGSAVVTVAIALLCWASAANWIRGEVSDGISSWHATLISGKERLTLAGAWTGFVAAPIYLFSIARWVTKAAAWWVYLWRVSRMPLRLNGMHPDHAGGLGFLEQVQTPFAILIVGTGASVAATVMYKVAVTGSALWHFGVIAPIVGFAIGGPLAFVIPMLFFFGRLLDEKERLSLDISAAYVSYLNTFRESWLERRDREEATRHLQSVDNQALVAMSSGLFFSPLEVAHGMRLVPFEWQSLGKLAASGATALAPLVLKWLHLSDPLQKLLDMGH